MARHLIDETRVEEKNVGALSPDVVAQLQVFAPHAIDDTDMDGLIDIDRASLDEMLGIISVDDNRMPLATYFADSLPLKNGPVTSPVPEKSRADFAKIAETNGGSLQALASPLAQHLSAIAVHSGHNVDEHVSLENPSGFSVRRDGRLRFDCVLFAQHAYSDLRCPCICIMGNHFHSGI